MHHIVWDWNGTLFDDLHIVVESVNAALASFDEGPIDAGAYQAHYQRPVPRFYESLLGRSISPEMWQTIDRVFHETYHDALDRAELAPDAVAAVDSIAAGGGTQSILSMWWHDQLVPAVVGFGLIDRMLLVDGLRGSPGENKARHLVAHIEALGGVHGLEEVSVVVIGDITDDADAAAAAGAGCVLYDSGSQPRATLELTGVPVANTLCEAVRLAGI